MAIMPGYPKIEDLRRFLELQPPSIYNQIYTGGPLTIAGARWSDEALISIIEQCEEEFLRINGTPDIMAVTRDIARGQ